jgi:hypothetical protein
MLRSSVGAAVACCTFLAACRTGNVPNQVLTKPVPQAAATPVARTAGPWTYRPSAQRQAFILDQRAIVVVRLDSTSRSDTISSHAEVFFTLAGSSGLSGSVTAYLVEAGGRGAATPAGLATPFPVRAEYSARGSQVEFTTPRDATPCSSVALAAAQSLRDLWFRIPDTLHAGASWEDSTSYIVCRDGIPLRATVHRTFRLSGATDSGGRLLIEITRVSRTAIAGVGEQFGEAIAVNGSGSGQLVYEFDPSSGEVVSANGSSVLDLSFRSRLRSQLMRQTVVTRIGRS